MIVYDVAMKIPETKQFPQHNIAGLISGITFVLFQSGEASMVGGNKHTHTHATQTLFDSHMKKKLSETIIAKLYPVGNNA